MWASNSRYMVLQDFDRTLLSSAFKSIYLHTPDPGKINEAINSYLTISTYWLACALYLLSHGFVYVIYLRYICSPCT